MPMGGPQAHGKLTILREAWDDPLVLQPLICCSGHRRNGKVVGKLELGFVLSLRQQTVKPFPASDSLRVVGILDLMKFGKNSYI
jgi:hypothetical protein